MPLHHALLSLLSSGDSYGYELKRAFERSSGPQWGPLNIGHVYQLLERLKRDGLVRVVRAESQTRRPERLIYGITEAGREELTSWLDSAGGRGTGYRDDLYLKLAAAARIDEARLEGVIERERAAALGELHALAELSGAVDALDALLVYGARMHVEARLAVLERAEQQLQGLVAATRPSRTGTAPTTTRAARQPQEARGRSR